MEPLDETFIKSLLQPGDILLYDSPGLFNLIIKLKRGEKYSHVEIFKSGGDSLASRNGIGVGQFPLRLEGLAAIYRVRPGVPWSFQKGLEWFPSVNGEGYDWLGLLAFTWAKFQGRDNGKMFCSEFVMRFFRACGLELFSPDTDADAVSPGLLTYSPKVGPLWLRKDKQEHGQIVLAQVNHGI